MRLSEYINKEFLIANLMRRAPLSKRMVFAFERGYRSGFADAIDIVKSRPAADVTETKYGKWIASISERKCSLCGKFHYSEDEYCPHCGAKMTGVIR